MTVPRTAHLDFVPWLAHEATCGQRRHELVGGDVHARTAGTRRHDLLTLELVSRLRRRARDEGCRTYADDVALRVGDDG